MKDNIKSQISKAKNIVQKKQILKFVFFAIFFIFLIFNLISSQTVPPVYFQMVNNDKKTVISFLQKIIDLPEYQKILEMNNSIYGNTIKEEIFKQENKQREVINNLEQQLNINPKARDVLYSLYRLYLAQGNTDKAKEYLKRTKDVDPALK